MRKTIRRTLIGLIILSITVFLAFTIRLIAHNGETSFSTNLTWFLVSSATTFTLWYWYDALFCKMVSLCVNISRRMHKNDKYSIINNADGNFVLLLNGKPVKWKVIDCDPKEAFEHFMMKHKNGSWEISKSFKTFGSQMDKEDAYGIRSRSYDVVSNENVRTKRDVSFSNREIAEKMKLVMELKRKICNEFGCPEIYPAYVCGIDNGLCFACHKISVTDGEYMGFIQLSNDTVEDFIKRLSHNEKISIMMTDGIVLGTEETDI